ncbi:hypothetical protein GUH15_33680, partial [Xanthomonas citri pv. citri]|nr:hypothetical protein [Xanthomonas citri pv. citri]
MKPCICRTLYKKVWAKKQKQSFIQTLERMNIQTAKQISIAEYLHSLGYSPVRRQGGNLW